MAKSEYKPYLETVEEVLIRFRTDTAGMEIIRDALFEVACDPRGLDEEASWSLPSDALELLVTLPSPGGVRRTAEDRLRKNVTDERSRRQAAHQELLRRASDAAREQVADALGREEPEDPPFEPTVVDPVVGEADEENQA